MININETWETKDKRIVKISEMKDSHLTNTINLLKSRLDPLIEGSAVAEANECSFEVLEQLEQHKALRELIDSRIKKFSKGE